MHSITCTQAWRYIFLDRRTVILWSRTWYTQALEIQIGYGQTEFVTIAEYYILTTNKCTEIIKGYGPMTVILVYSLHQVVLHGLIDTWLDYWDKGTVILVKVMTSQCHLEIQSCYGQTEPHTFVISIHHTQLELLCDQISYGQTDSHYLVKINIIENC